MRITELPSPITNAAPETTAALPAEPAAFTDLCRHFGTSGRIDWETGAAQLDRAAHRAPLTLRFTPRGDGSPADQARQFAALTGLIEGLTDVLRQARHWQEPDDCKLPRSFELDGDVLRVEELVLARREPDGTGWRCHIPPQELHTLLRYFDPNGVRGDGAGLGYETEPLRGDRSATTADASLSAARRVIFQHWGHGGPAADLASKHAASSRLLSLSRLGKVREAENSGPLARQPGEDQRPLRVTCVGASSPLSGEASEMTISRMTPEDLVQQFSRVLETMTPDGETTETPSHVSLVSCFLDSPLVDGNYGGDVVRELSRKYGRTDITVSVRSGEYGIDEQGRKYVRTAEGDFMHRRPGSVAVLSLNADGTIARKDKYPDLGQGCIWDRAPSPAPLLSWLDTSGRGAEGLGDAWAATAHAWDAQAQWRMGEVPVSTLLLERMGWIAPGEHASAPAALRRLESWREARFDAGRLTTFLATDGHAPQRIHAMRLLKQLMRNGATSDKLLRSSGSPTAQHAARQLLRAIDAAVDADLHLAPALWLRLWAPGTAPALPLRTMEASS